MFKEAIHKKLHLIKKPHLKVYEGFGNSTHCTLMGHALTQSASPREIYKNGFFHNTLALLKTFMIKTMPDALIEVKWQGKIVETNAAADGFFIVDLPNEQPLEPGKYKVEVALKGNADQQLLNTAISHIIIPQTNQFAFISDIDDTFLISHSSLF
ncbi:hypothetical protein [Niabella hibiscisoli]|uniref:hypothetical protein n=1 Tax=Niabella hibiscisoli TaxID=1825928 RepID=UPI001F0DDA71|nr:hypothetical protein [Niabella hibiscisoli]MCH5716972.1 hypothetical protein [Niabella hibiscisoli]